MSKPGCGNIFSQSSLFCHWQVMQLKMAKRLQSISSMALNHMTLDTESDYDTDDMDATLTDADKLRLRGTSLSGMSVDSQELTMADIQKLKLNPLDIDSSDGEGQGCAFENENGTVKRRTSKTKKKRAHNKGDSIHKVLDKKNSLGGVSLDSTPEVTLESDSVSQTGMPPGVKNGQTGNGPVLASQENKGHKSDINHTSDLNISNTTNSGYHGGGEAGGYHGDVDSSELESVSSIPSSSPGVSHVNGGVSSTISDGESTSSIN